MTRAPRNAPGAFRFRTLSRVLLLGLVAGTPALATDFKIAVDRPGPYRVTYDELAATAPLAESAGEAVASARLELTNRGEPVPIFVEDGGDGRFGPGDALLFEGDRLAGDSTYFASYSRWNVYRLRVRGGGPGPAAPGARLAAPPTTMPAGRAVRHLEEQELRVRFAIPAGRAEPEIWYWAKLTAIDPKPFGVEIDLGDRLPASTVRLAVGLRGWSRRAGAPAEAAAEHRVEARWNGAVVGSVEWGGQEAATLLATLPAASVGAKGRLELVVPRRDGADGNPLVDVVLVDWCELEYERAEGVKREPLAAGWIAADRESDWRTTAHRADYLMIVNPKFRAAIEPLARLHRAGGLAVEVVDVEDVYDEWADGIEDPRAIRDFVSFAYHEWQRPAPRFVLLVGDASWDPFHAVGDDRRYADWTYRPGEVSAFVKNASTPYGDREAEHGLVPTISVATIEGEAASDNGFVAVDGDDERPDLAIGRFPASRPEEVEAMVAKSVRYATREDSGEWQKRALWLTDQYSSFQERSDRLADDVAKRGVAPVKIYPEASDPADLDRKKEIRDTLAEGQLFVHFVGHGGRYIWRTGPPDLVNNRDLFTVEDVDALPPGGKLPVVLGMTCYSAPFDHPTADSIGEKLVRANDRGAVAVIAASWRNDPTEEESRRLLDELLVPGATIGEAFLRAKRAVDRSTFTEMYNLLGDPALRVATPTNRNVIRWKTASEVDNFGYDVYRGDGPDGPFARINPDPVLGAGTTDEPQAYRFVDSTIDPRKGYYYYVESISLGGVREKFTPVVPVAAKVKDEPAAEAAAPATR